MVFSSIPFLFAFLPAVILAERAVSGIRAKNAVLLAASILFYAYGEPVYVFLMLASVVVNHSAARWIAACSDNKKKAMWIEAGAVLFNLGMLFVFKYAGMTVSLLNQGLHTALPVPQITLPIGISFYTFQALSYVVDVRRGTAPAQKSIFSTALYLSFFPQLIAGPIVKYSDISAQMLDRNEDPQQTAQGIRRFVAGLSKKVLLANQLGHMTDLLRTIPAGETGMLWSWAAAAAYALHIYFDFSGYSDMAIGLGKIFGFTFKENFRHPYTASSVKDFWRRWHISLSSWFRDYLYIPLGGNRKGTARKHEYNGGDAPGMARLAVERADRRRNLRCGIPGGTGSRRGNRTVCGQGDPCIRAAAGGLFFPEDRRRLGCRTALPEGSYGGISG